MKQATNEWVQRAWKVFPGGPSAGYNLPDELSVILTRGKGARVYDITGKKFIDFTMGWGSVIL